MEGKEWNNGVFTYAFLNGMKDNHADKNKDNHISLSEIRTYVFEQVKKLTGGRQVPTSRTENRYNDFEIN
jgi:transcription termination factor Rho